jgi:hypothetical protein
MSDNINHPSHYSEGPAKCQCGRPIECIDITQHMDFLRGNALKYIWRAGRKTEDKIEDLKKAIWYLSKEIQNTQVK